MSTIETSPLFESLRKQQKQAVEDMRRLKDKGENSDFAIREVQRLNELVEEERARLIEDAENREAVDRTMRAMGPGRVSGEITPEEREYAKAFKSAIKAKSAEPIEVHAENPRSWYQPGLEQRTLLKTTATQAMPVSVWDQIVVSMVESSAVLAAGATLITTGTGEDLQVPKATANSTAGIVNEGALISNSDPTLGVATLKAYKYATAFQISQELANDTPTNLLGFLASQAGQALAAAFGPHLITGTGSSQPSGIVTGASVGKTGPTGTTVSLGTQSTAGQGTDILYDLIGSLAEPYSRQPATSFLLTNPSLAIARKLKDSAGQPVAGMVGGGLNAAVSGAPSGNNVVLGYPAFVDPNVASMVANAKSIVFGDVSKYVDLDAGTFSAAAVT